MKNTLLIVTLSTALSACAAHQSSGPLRLADAGMVAAARPDLAAKARVGTHDAGTSTERASEDELPHVALTEELLYKILSAEFAAQRGEWQSAYVTMLGLSQETRDPRLARRAAEIALNARHADEALSAVRLWRNLAPHSDEAAQYYLTFTILTGDLDEAKPIIAERLKEARPQTRGLLAFQIQRLLARAKDKAAAFSLLQDVLEPYRDLPETHLALSQAAFASGNTERAQQEARAALKAKPDSELAALTLAQVTPQQAQAARILHDFLSRNPHARDVRVAYARMMVEQKQYAKARSEFETLLKDQPEDLTSLYALGVLGVQMQDLKAAESYLKTYLDVLAAKPDDERDSSQALMLLAQIAEQRKDSEAALKWLSKIEPGEAYLGAQIKRAQVIAKRGDVEMARNMLHEIDTSSEREKAQVVMADGQILRDAGRLPEALAVFKNGLQHFPTNTDLLYDYAMTAEKSNQWDVMENALRKIMELDPNNYNAYNALGYSLAERNIRLEEARSLIEKALTLSPEDPFIMDSMGWVKYRMGDLKEAENLLRQAYSARPDVEIAAHLGEVLWVRGQKDDAQKLWRDAQTKDPQNDTLKSTLARLNVSL